MKENLKHLAIILDGNRRWAVEQGKPKIFGHTQGAKNLKRVLTTAKKHNITHITTWALSIDNLKRDEKELKHLFSLFEKLFGYIGQLNKENIKVNFIGDLSLLPTSTEKKLLNIKKQTKNNTGLVWTLALAYGGRHEIVRATKKIIEQGIKAKKLNEEVFSSFLDTHNLPEVDLVIRTGARKRLSGFLAWQTAYAELYFTDLNWPDFNEVEFDKAINWFHSQDRTFGKN